MMNQPLFPIAFSGKIATPKGTRILAADTGGTKTDVGLFEMRENGPVLMREATYHSKEWAGLDQILKHFRRESEQPDQLSIAVAGPVLHGKAELTNLGWIVDSSRLRRELGISKVTLINDLEAMAYGLAALTPEDLLTLYPGNDRLKGNAAIIAPGTGLGEAGLFWDGQVLHPFATEGGHSDFGPRNRLDIELLEHLQKKYRHVSWERLVSGPGIYTIFKFLETVKCLEVPQQLLENIKQDDPAIAISEGAKEGCQTCVEALRLFVRYLAEESSNLALKFKATGGLFIGGGIVHKIWNATLKSVFLEHFFQVGRLGNLLGKVPVYIILNRKTPLLGAAQCGAFCKISHFTPSHLVL